MDHSAGCAPDKARILGNLDVRKAVALPEIPAEGQGIAGHPRPWPSFVSIQEGLGGFRLIVVKPAGPRKISAAFHHHLYLPAHTVRRIPVVIVPVHNDFAAGPLAGIVPL